MHRPLLLIAIACAVLVQTHVVARMPSPMALSRMHKRVDATPQPYALTADEYYKRLTFIGPDQAPTMDQTANISAYMAIGLPFYGVQMPDHQSGVDDQSNYLAGDPNDFSKWAEGAFDQVYWCAAAVNETLFGAMQACGPEEKCDVDFVALSLWGTATGMDWSKDGLMLSTCVAYQTIKSECPDQHQTPCKVTILGDLTSDMYPPSVEVSIIGSGATTLPQMASQINEYNESHQTSYSLPTGGKTKRSEQRRLVDDCDGDEGNDIDI